MMVNLIPLVHTNTSTVHVNISAVVIKKSPYITLKWNVSKKILA